MFKPFDWSGTATRTHFWSLFLIWFFAMIGTSALPLGPTAFGAILLVLAVLQTLLVSVIVRRLHDFGRSGLWAILTFVPLVGLGVILWIGLAKGQPEQATDWPPKRRYRLGQFLVVLIGMIIVSRMFWTPYWIPSSSMKPTLLIGDYLAATPIDNAESPRTGDVYLYRHPVTLDIFVARLIAVAGDRVQMKDGAIILNDQMVPRDQIADFVEPFGPQGAMRNLPRCANGSTAFGESCIKQQFVETLPNGVSYHTLEIMPSTLDNTGVYTVPDGQLFFMGDNRDNAIDSRISPAQRGVGFVPVENLAGKPTTIIFSSAGPSLGAFWKWRADRFFLRID